MMKWLALALLLGGCTSNLSPVQQSCEAAANDDPVVKRIILTGLGNPHAMHEDQDKLAAAKQDAMLACLRRRGVIRQGGVERQKPL